MSYDPNKIQFSIAGQPIRTGGPPPPWITILRHEGREVAWVDHTGPVWRADPLSEAECQAIMDWIAQRPEP